MPHTNRHMPVQMPPYRSISIHIDKTTPSRCKAHKTESAPLGPLYFNKLINSERSPSVFRATLRRYCFVKKTTISKRRYQRDDIKEMISKRRSRSDNADQSKVDKEDDTTPQQSVHTDKPSRGGIERREPSHRPSKTTQDPRPRDRQRPSSR
jgi:hypothetical protein